MTSQLNRGLHFLRFFFTRGQFWPSGIVVACVCLCVRQSWACPSDNSSTVQARITKFGREKQNTLVKIPIVFWGNWPWPSRSNWTSNSKLTHRGVVKVHWRVPWVGGLFSWVVATFTLWSKCCHRGCLNDLIFSNLGLCAACWAHVVCYHELWLTSVRHPFYI